MRCCGLLTCAVGMLIAGSAFAQTSPGWFTILPSAVYQTGDSWIAGGVTYRLYGAQACIRGTSFTNAAGVKRDCGEASLVMLAALIRDLHPQCHRVGVDRPGVPVWVVCTATPNKGAGAGSRLDLGTALIASGYGFASLKPDGTPVHTPYFVAQLVAQRSKAGLWAFADVPEPNAIILNAMRRGPVKLTADRSSGSFLSRSAP